MPNEGSPGSSPIKASPARRKGIQSVEIGVGVLNAVVRLGAPASLTDIARAADMSVSQAHRYLASFVNSGLLRQDSQSGLYDMAAGAIRIGLAALARVDIFAEAAKAVQAFVDATGRTALITVWSEHGPTVIRWFSGAPPVFTTISIGSRLPVTRSATGRLFLTYLGANFVDDVVRAELAADKASANLDLAKIKAETRKRRFAEVDSEVVPGLRSIAMPIFDLQKQLCMVVTTIASNSFDEAGDSAIFARLQEACDDLTRSLGGSWPT